MRKLTTSKNFVAYMFILPFIILHIVVTVIPAVYSLIMSFFKYRGYGEAVFVGLENYIKLFTYRNTWIALGNTFLYFVIKLVVCILLGFLFALAIRSKHVVRFQRVYKPLIYVPQMCAIVASSLLFQVLFATNNGIINDIFNLDIGWTTDPAYMKIPVIILLLWRNTGWFFIILLTGMTSISADLIEAAEIDGANAFKRAIHIILPLMKPIFSFLVITEAINSLKLFSEPNLVIHRFQLAPYDVAPYMNIVVNQINSGSFGMASAAGWILCILTFILTMVMMKGLKII